MLENQWRGTRAKRVVRAMHGLRVWAWAGPPIIYASIRSNKKGIKLRKVSTTYLKYMRGIETLSDDEKWCINMKYRHEQKVKPLISEL